MSLPIHDLSNRSPRQWQPLAAELSLQRGRVHEFCGPARIALAALVLAKSQGSVIWVHPGWASDWLNAAGLSSMADPARLIFVRTAREEETLWAGEEALRSGAAPLVILDLTTPPALTPVRRLHLAAEAGAAATRGNGTPAPLGLMLLAENGGAQGAESRWHTASAPSSGLLSDPQRGWTLTRLRARMEMPARWQLYRTASGAEKLTPQPLDTPDGAA